MESKSTEALAGLTSEYSSETENCSDRPKPPKGRCEECGFRHFAHYRTLGDREQWECVNCGGMVEIPAEGSA